MSYRSILIVMENEKELVCILKRFDGSPVLFGRDLAEFLIDMKIGDYYHLGEPYYYSSDMGCLASQIINKFWEQIGDMKILPLGTVLGHEDATYILTNKDNLVSMEVRDGNRSDSIIYDGTPEDYIPWICHDYQGI